METERNKQLMAIPGFIVLIKKRDDSRWWGPVEESFGLDVLPWNTQFFWSSNHATSNFGGDFIVDGYKEAHESVKFWSERHPDWVFYIYNAREEKELPVIIDWDKWLDSSQPSDTLSGVRNKFGARNLFISPKEISNIVVTVTMDCDNPMLEESWQDRFPERII